MTEQVVLYNLALPGTRVTSLIWALKADSQIYAFTFMLGTSYGIK